MNNVFVQYLVASVNLVAQSLNVDESILRIEEGQTRYGRQTFVYYKLLIATFEQLTGNSPVHPRTVVVQVNVDPPHTASYVDESQWQAFPAPGP
jgi:hypothetical protein